MSETNTTSSDPTEPPGPPAARAPAGPPDAPRGRRAAFVFVFITVLLDMLALGMIAPVLPKLVASFLGNDAAQAARIFGMFGTVWALMQFLFSPVMGALSDRFGRRPVILLSNFGLGLDYVLMALSPTLGWLFAGRVVSGITAASYSTASAYIADVTPPEKRAGAFGLLGTAFGIGFVVGPAIGGLLGSISPRLPFWAAAVFSLANALYGLFVLPESLRPAERAPLSLKNANPLGALALLRSHPQVLGLAAVSFFNYLAHEVLPSTFVLYATYRYGWGEGIVGLTLAGVGISSGLVQGLLTRPLVARLGERRALLAGIGFGIAAFAAYGLARSGPLFFVGVPLMALWGLYGPSAMALMTRHVSASTQGQLQGATSSLRGISGLIGPSLFTMTFASFINRTDGLSLPGAPFLLAAALLLLSVPLAAYVTRRT